LERYYQDSADSGSGTQGHKQVCLKELSECSFSYSDGQVWKVSWDEASAYLPRMLKINFKFKKDTKAQEFLVNIPISP
jgi:hypothetical protein